MKHTKSFFSFRQASLIDDAHTILLPHFQRTMQAANSSIFVAFYIFRVHLRLTFLDEQKANWWNTPWWNRHKRVHIHPNYFCPSFSGYLHNVTTRRSSAAMSAGFLSDLRRQRGGKFVLRVSALCLGRVAPRTHPPAGCIARPLLNNCNDR